ncbi:unnamed protein product [Lathyrus oleraceus]|uniref:Protein TAB2 chloroplastic n=1 Tax=Pisum sativum TaxID=3888 RepID=A0A9D4X182_PEA|nr:protein TAB2 homolog, chloroplastic-like [Pisum sativum]KAI5410470.1 Protein TAB2 chloroplastic [Pisum sativum]
MATLSFNSTTIKTPSFNYPNSLITKLSSSKPTIKFPFFTNNKPFLQIRTCSISETSATITQEEVEEVEEVEEDKEDPTAETCYLDPETDPAKILSWELDFCSRPILDARGKKLWELVVCDKSLSLQYTKYFPNNVINSITLKDSIVGICDELDLPVPRNIRFFRAQMQTIITKACKELDIVALPSKRCLSLLLWLEERFETVYSKHPGFQKGSKPLLPLDNPFPTKLPEDLFGERWAFVQLPYSAVREEASASEERFGYGSGLDLDLLGIEIDEKTLIPGLAVASSRAKDLSAFMNELELCTIEADAARANLTLSVAISTRYVYATYKKTPTSTKESEAWEAAKKASGGLHFLAIQNELDSEKCVGFWLLLDLPPPPV